MYNICVHMYVYNFVSLPMYFENDTHRLMYGCSVQLSSTTHSSYHNKTNISFDVVYDVC